MQVDLGAAATNVLMPNDWVRSRSLRYRDSFWRDKMGAMEVRTRIYIFCDAILYQNYVILPRQARDKYWKAL